MPNKDNQTRMLLNLLQEFKNNPSYSDTLTSKTRPGVEAELDYSGNPMGYLKHMFFGK